MKKSRNKVLVYVGIIIALALVGSFIYCNSDFVRFSKQMDLGQKYLEEQNYEAAIVAFEAAIEINPMSVEAYQSVAEAYIGMENLNKAAEMLKRGFDLSNDEGLKQKLNELNSKIENIEIEKEENIQVQEQQRVEREKNDQFPTISEQEIYSLGESHLYKLNELGGSLLVMAYNQYNFCADVIEDLPIIFFSDILFYYYEQCSKKKILPIDIPKSEYCEGEDPKGYTNAGYYKADRVAFDWIVSEVFGTSLNGFYPVDDEGCFLYEADDSVYYMMDGVGISYAENVSSEILNYNNGWYEIAMSVDGELVFLEAALCESEQYSEEYFWKFAKIQKIESIEETDGEIIRESEIDKVVTQESGSNYGTYIGNVSLEHNEADSAIGGWDYDYYYLNFGQEVELICDFYADEALGNIILDGIAISSSELDLMEFVNQRVVVNGKVIHSGVRGGLMIVVDSITILDSD